jgi:hypothetical protein
MAPKTEHIYLSGKSKWTQTKQVDKYGKWGICLYLDPASKETWLKMKEKGILNEINEDDDGEFIRLRRDQQKTFRDGTTRGFVPIKVLDKQGNPYDGNIGNGSDVTCKVEMYSFKKPFGPGLGYGIRLEAIRVDNLVPFEGKKKDAFDPDTAKLIEGLADAPEPIF